MAKARTKTDAVLAIGTNILVQRDKVKEVTEGGIILPEQAKTPARSGVVVSVGTRVRHVSVGERVLFNEYAGTVVSWGSNNLLAMSEVDVLAVVA